MNDSGHGRGRKRAARSVHKTNAPLQLRQGAKRAQRSVHKTNTPLQLRQGAEGRCAVSVDSEGKRRNGTPATPGAGPPGGRVGSRPDDLKSLQPFTLPGLPRMSFRARKMDPALRAWWKSWIQPWKRIFAGLWEVNFSTVP